MGTRDETEQWMPIATRRMPRLAMSVRAMERGREIWESSRMGVPRRPELGRSWSL
jgi:hypothetical protein